MVLIAGVCSEAVATEVVAESWRSHHGVFTCDELRDASVDCTLCHDAGTNALNPYAEDIQFHKYDQDVAWIVAITVVEEWDSDSDGVTNKVEINDDCTYPGDVLSVPVEDQSWWNIKTLYR